MAESKMESQGPGGVKYIIWAVLGVIAILVTVKELGFTPTKVTAPGVSVELKETGGIAPKPANDGAAPPPAENTAELAAKVKDLESQLKAGTLPENNAPVAVPATPGRPVNTNPPAETAPMNVAGNWNGVIMMNITQNGSSIVVKLGTIYGIVGAGQGTVNGRNVNVRYQNNYFLWGTFTGTVSPDGQQMNVTDYGSGTPQNLVFTRQ